MACSWDGSAECQKPGKPKSSGAVWAQIFHGNCPCLCEDFFDELQIRHITEVLVEIPRISQVSLKSAPQHKSINVPHGFVLCSAGTTISMQQIRWIIPVVTSQNIYTIVILLAIACLCQLADSLLISHLISTQSDHPKLAWFGLLGSAVYFHATRQHGAQDRP